MSDREQSKLKAYRQLGFLLTIPMMLAVAPVVGYFIGDWLDARFGTDPVLTLVFLGFGFVAGVRETIVLVKKANRSMEEDEPDRRGP